MTKDDRGAAAAVTMHIDGHDFRIYESAQGGARPWRTEWRHASLGSGWEWDNIGDSSDRRQATELAAEFVLHLKQKAEFRRETVHAHADRGQFTPWGGAQSWVKFGRGVIQYSTARHGGFRVSPGLLADFPAHLRNSGGWYEEDVEWCKVATAVPHLFTVRERRLAEETLRHWLPETWEIQYGRALAEGESRAKDERLFFLRHAQDYLTVSAQYSQQFQDMVEVTASRGGRREPGCETRVFLVPAAEYRNAGQRFVVDLDRHQPLVPAPAAGGTAPGPR